ncbi:MAG: 5'/3'-nucleotidase SurE [Treponema sp.]|jgi:5'-nucleotidase|nr:5'/3'-nucleotidase SurE [Treponema sp.]
MNILLTNDDGVDSPGILILAEVLKARLNHCIFILAPDKNRSGVSHGLSILNEPLKISQKEEGVWFCSGLPADCVIAAALGGEPCKPDIVISGINQGPNLGNDIIYSGTCAAARQAVLSGLPGIALSLKGAEDYRWESAAEYTAEHLDEFLSLWKEDIFINVNFPDSRPLGIAHTWPAVKNYNDLVSVETGPEGNIYCSFFMGRETVEDDEGSDHDAVSRNWVSVSPVCVYPVVRRDLCAGVPDYAAAGQRRRAPMFQKSGLKTNSFPQGMV